MSKLKILCLLALCCHLLLYRIDAQSILVAPPPPLAAVAALVPPVEPVAPLVVPQALASAPIASNNALGQFSKFGLVPFEPLILAMPLEQLTFVRAMTAKDLALFREILNEALEMRNKFAPSVKLMFKYAGKLLGNFIRNRRAEAQLKERIEPKPEFFTMLANLVQTTIDRSTAIKIEKGYTKYTVDVLGLRARTEALFNYIERIINVSPLGAYLRWDTLRLYMDEPANPLYNGDLVEEVADLVAQFRAIGYEKTIFVARRIVNLLRMFARGIMPNSENEVV